MKILEKSILRIGLIPVLFFVSMNMFGETGLGNSIDSYTGSNVGVRYFKQNYSLEDKTSYQDKGLGLEIGADGYIFGEGRKTGLYASLSAHFPIRADISKDDNENERFYYGETYNFATDFTMMIGLASRISIGDSIELLGGVGPSLTLSGYIEGLDTNREIREIHLTGGVGFNPSIILKVNNMFYVTVGGKANINLFSVRSKETITNVNGSKLFNSSQEKIPLYFEANFTAYVGFGFKY